MRSRDYVEPTCIIFEVEEFSIYNDFFDPELDQLMHYIYDYDYYDGELYKHLLQMSKNVKCGFHLNPSGYYETNEMEYSDPSLKTYYENHNNEPLGFTKFKVVMDNRTSRLPRFYIVRIR